MTKRLANFISIALTVLSCLSAASSAQSTAGLAAEMQLKGKAIAQYLKAVQNVQSCGIGQFTGPKQSPASGIGEMLRSELETHGMTIVGAGSAEYTVKGHCRFEDDGFGSHQMIVDIAIEDDLGGTVKNLPTRIDLPDGQSVAFAGTTDKQTISVKTSKADDIAKVMLVSTNLTEINEANDLAINKERRKVNRIIKDIKKPSSHVAGSKIQTGASSPYAMEIAINGTVRAPEQSDSFYYAPMQRDDTCHVKFHNNADHDVYIQAFIDGINSFNFADNPRDRKIGGYIIAAHQSATLKGWYQDSKHVEEFQVTPHAKSALARNAADGKQTDSNQEGIIAVAVHRWYKPGETSRLKGKGGGKPDSMGFGKDLLQKSKTVKGHKGDLEEVISVRYRK